MIVITHVQEALLASLISPELVIAGMVISLYL